MSSALVGSSFFGPVYLSVPFKGTRKNAVLGDLKQISHYDRVLGILVNIPIYQSILSPGVFSVRRPYAVKVVCIRLLV